MAKIIETPRSRNRRQPGYTVLKVKEAGYGVARKISQNGKYFGLWGEYNFEHKEGKLTL